MLQSIIDKIKQCQSLQARVIADNATLRSELAKAKEANDLLSKMLEDLQAAGGFDPSGN